MKNLILCAALAAAACSAPVAKVFANESDKSCCPKVVCQPETVEVCRRCYSKCSNVCGCQKVVHYIEVTYKTTDCCGRTTVWKKLYRA